MLENYERIRYNKNSSYRIRTEEERFCCLFVFSIYEINESTKADKVCQKVLNK